MKPFILLAAFSLSPLAHAADAPVWYGESNCKIAEVLPSPKGDSVKWSGACKDGYADGKGVLEWHAPKGKLKVDAALVRGEISGEGTMTGDFGTYIGTFKRGLPDGQGYFKFTNGRQYEGSVVDARFDGLGIEVDYDGSRYDGHWKNDKRNGYGKQVYTLGGSYEGEWKDGKFEGKGVIVHAGSGRHYEGLFEDGRVAGIAPKAPRELGRFAVRSREPRTDSRIAPTDAIAYAPPDATWEQLTPGQQNVVRSFYKTLEDGDEPPYPLTGTRKLYTDVAKVRNTRPFQNVTGTLRVYLLVGKDGKPKSVTSYGSLDPEFIRFAGIAMMLQEFKPAICHGEPCDMIYPTVFSFVLAP